MIVVHSASTRESSWYRIYLRFMRLLHSIKVVKKWNQINLFLKRSCGISIFGDWCSIVSKIWNDSLYHQDADSGRIISDVTPYFRRTTKSASNESFRVHRLDVDPLRSIEKTDLRHSEFNKSMSTDVDKLWISPRSRQLHPSLESKHRIINERMTFLRIFVNVSSVVAVR